MGRTEHTMDILIAEDDPFIQRYLRQMLSHMGHVVQVVSDGGEAMTRIRTHDFDLVLMDCHMPGVDGLTATRVIRSEPMGHQPLIVALSADARSPNRQACLDAGMDGFLSKPIRRRELEHALSQYRPHPHSLLIRASPTPRGSPAPGRR